MSRWPLPALAARLGAALRRAAAGLRSLPDPLAVGWRLAAARRAPLLAAVCLAGLALSALLAPRLYLTDGAAFGLPTEQWPGVAARLAALSLLAARPWGAAILAASLLVGAVQAAVRLAPRGEATPEAAPAPSAGERTLLYSDRPLASVQRRLRLLAAALGYTWRPGDGQVAVLDRTPTRRRCATSAALALTAAACLLLLWPRVSAVEVVALAQGDTATLSLVPGLVLGSRTAISGQPRFVVRTAAGDVAAVRQPSGVWIAAGLSIVGHGSGPALLVRPGSSPLSGTADDPGTVAIGFSAAENSQLVTVPEIDRTIRVSLVSGGPAPAFDVQLVDAGGTATGSAYRLDVPAVLTLSGVTLAFRPASFDVLSVWRAPLLLPLVLVLAAVLVAALLTWGLRGPPVVLAMRASGPVVGVELQAADGLARSLWLPLLRLALR
ncbi:MAG: hypothetical protein ACYC5O_01350 [Anaerolineae bacterium]